MQSMKRPTGRARRTPGRAQDRWRARKGRVWGAALLGAASVLGGGALLLVAGPAGAATSSTLYVSPGGTSGAADASCQSAAYSSISAAVAAATSGDTITVCAGTYDEMVTVQGVAVTLQGTTGAVIDASGKADGIVVQGAAAAGSTVEGFTVEHAQQSGILVQGTSKVTVADNVVTDNDLACQPQTGSNDCGEGLHLRAVTDSTVQGNTVSGNTGGILVTDGIPAGSLGAKAFGYSTPYAGPSSGNLIEDNTVKDNVWDCGITLPSHNALAVSSSGTPQPTEGGVYANTVEDNVVTGNGTEGGGGAGILMAAPFPGTGSYDNVVKGNTVSGNGQAGITVHSHAPDQDVNGNQFLDNTIGQNAVGETNPGTGVFSQGSPTAGDPDAGVISTTGILVYSAVQPVTGTVASGNQISDDYYGIWTDNVETQGISGNSFSSVTVPTYAEPAPSSGYLMAAADGGIFTFGAMPFVGSGHGLPLSAPVVGVARTPDSGGSWLATANGGVFTLGDARFNGSLGGVKLAAPIVGIAATPGGHGYWLVGKDGGVFTFGTAGFYGSLPGLPASVRPNVPVVGLVPTASGKGYWEVTAAGDVYSFGDATFFGSTGNLHLDAPVVGAVAAG
jgi:nitrous oxidase accessory protein NosD